MFARGIASNPPVHAGSGRKSRRRAQAQEQASIDMTQCINDCTRLFSVGSQAWRDCISPCSTVATPPPSIPGPPGAQHPSRGIKPLGCGPGEVPNPCDFGEPCVPEPHKYFGGPPGCPTGKTLVCHYGKPSCQPIPSKPTRSKKQPKGMSLARRSGKQLRGVSPSGKRGQQRTKPALQPRLCDEIPDWCAGTGAILYKDGKCWCRDPRGGGFLCAEKDGQCAGGAVPQLPPSLVARPGRRRPNPKLGCSGKGADGSADKLHCSDPSSSCYCASCSYAWPGGASGVCMWVHKDPDIIPDAPAQRPITSAPRPPQRPGRMLVVGRQG